LAVQQVLALLVAERLLLVILKKRGRNILKRIFLIFLLFLLFFSLELRAREADEKFYSEKYYNVLKTYVDEKGKVNYRELKENKKEMKIFLDKLNKLKPEDYQSWNDEEKIALWINAYNALTLKAILDHYPLEESSFRTRKYPRNSIRQISGVWDKIRFSVMGKEITLDHIEHKILRKEFNEPRIHMALVCAARGCPPLRQEPYKAETLSDQLDDQARRFLSSDKNFLINKEQSVVYLSSIFKWYGKDFIGSYIPTTGFNGHRRKERAVLHFISLYLQEEDRKFLEKGSYNIKYLNYDWTLNEQEN
jgi:hypothetical protein